jgi:hypothetical protein
MNKKSPRHSARSAELKEGTGPIIAMCPCGEFLEIYKVDKTFRVRSPESVDPKETNPNAPWVSSPVDDIGCSNPIIARVFLQGHEILKSAFFEGEINKDFITIRLHACKESLLACEKIAKRIEYQIDKIIHQVNAQGIARDSSGRVLSPFPQVANLDSDCGAFLIQLNRAIKIICELPSFFISLNRVDSNFNHLGKRLTKIVGEKAPLIEFINANAEGIRYLIDLRNFHEHPKEKKTIIDNFRLMPDMRIRVPMWYIEGQEPRPIKEEMIAAIEFLVQMAEAMLIHLVMFRLSKQFPFIILEIPEKDIDANCPIKYKLSIDISKLKQV